MGKKLGVLAGAAGGLIPIMMGSLILVRSGWPHFGAANLVANGLAIAALAALGWPARLAWTWWLYAFILLFVGINDLAILLRAGRFPLTILPLTFGAVGLALSAPSVLRRPRSTTGA
jgi:hypothetical protein